MMKIKTLAATEYITPLREGGSLPAVVRADNGELYAMKFAGAGQGTKALVAEIIAGEIARLLGFNVPEIVIIDLDPAIGHSEPDAEIQDLLHASAGLNLGFRFLSHAASFNLLVTPRPDAKFASDLVWFDAFVTNVDRTPRNVNMLIHEGKIWLIDHGAALYFQHNWQNHLRQSETPFPMIKDHVLLPLAAQLAESDTAMKAALANGVFEEVLAQVPDEWLAGDSPFDTPDEHRGAFVAFLKNRLEKSHIFVEAANRARSGHI